MRQNRKQYTVIIRGRVQEVGFRGYLEDLCKSLRLRSVVYNTAPNELKLVCEASRNLLDNLSSRIKDYKLAKIREIRIEEGAQLPYPPRRAVYGIEREIYKRLDEGVKILHSVDAGVKKIDRKLDKLDKLDMLDEINKTLQNIANKL